MMSPTTSPKSHPSCFHPHLYHPPQSSVPNTSPAHDHPYRTLNVDDFFATIRQKNQLPIIFTTINTNIITSQQLLFISHMNESISKLKEAISNLQNKVDWQKLIAQNNWTTFWPRNWWKESVGLPKNILVEHGFWVSDLTPSVSSKSSLNTMPVPSSSPSIYETADEFLDWNFPAMALGSSGNPTVVSDNEDWFGESMV